MAADGKAAILSLQTADRWPDGCRWQGCYLVAADGRQVATSLQIALQERPCRAGLDGAPPQTPQMGPQTPSALTHGKMDETGALPTGEITASEGP
jgi:hypothetical protein